MELDTTTSETLFPFHLLIDETCMIISAGRAIRKLLPRLADKPRLQSIFEITTPRNLTTYEAFSKACGSKIILRNKEDPPFRLECSGAPLANGTVFLVGSLIAKSLAEVDALRLTFDDFAPHERILPFLAAVQSQIVALKDASKLANMQAELRHHRDHLQELVDDRTAELKEKSLRLADALIQEKASSKLQRDFISIVSHEFRTPLTIIDGAVQRLQRSKDATDLAGKLEDWAPQIRQSVSDMTHLIDSTLTSRKLEDGRVELKLESCDPAAVIEKVAHQITETGDHEVRLDLDKLPTHVESDVEALEHIFSNLISNAVKYSPSARYVDVSSWPEGAFFCIAVTDQGIGIPEGDLPKLFHRFFRARSASDFEGTGLGLNIAREYVELLSGRIDVDSTLGCGTTVTVRLPWRQEGDTMGNTMENGREAPQQRSDHGQDIDCGR